MFYTSRKTMYKVLSYIHNLVWGLGRFVCIGGIVRWVTAKETVTRFQISQRLASLPTSTPCSCSWCYFKVTTSFTIINISAKIDQKSPCRKLQTSSSWLLLLLTWVAWTVMFSLASKWGNTSQTEMRKIFNGYYQCTSTCLLIQKMWKYKGDMAMAKWSTPQTLYSLGLSSRLIAITKFP